MAPNNKTTRKSKTLLLVSFYGNSTSCFIFFCGGGRETIKNGSEFVKTPRSRMRYYERAFWRIAEKSIKFRTPVRNFSL